MNCEDCRTTLAEYVLGSFEPSEPSEISVHLQSCPDCRSKQREWQETWGMLPLALDPCDPPQQVEQALFARLTKSSPNGIEPIPASRVSPISWRAVAGLAALCASYFVTFWLGRSFLGRDMRAAQVPEVAQRQLNPEMRFISLHSPGEQARVRGYSVYDAHERQLHFYGLQLPPLADGQIYRLWLATPAGTYVSLSTLELTGEQGSIGRVVADIPDHIQEFCGLAVTIETGTDPLQPSGRVELTADFR